jgi:hypothetical protein
MEQSQGRAGAMALQIIDSYRNNWRHFFNRTFDKLKQTVDAYEIPDNVSFVYGQSVSPLLRFLPGYWIVFPLGLAGFVISQGSWKRHLLVSLYALACVAGLQVTIVRARYRLTLAAILVLFAAVALIRLTEAVRDRRSREVAFLGGLILAFCASQQFVSSALAAASEHRVRAVDFRAAARAYVRDERYDRAADEMSRLLKRARSAPSEAENIPLYEAEYYLFSAQHSIQNQDAAAGRKQLEKAWEIYSSVPKPENYLYYEMGQVYLKLNDNERAVELFRHYLEREPTGPSSDNIRRLLEKIIGTPW